jgi:hypothetical protein
VWSDVDGCGAAFACLYACVVACVGRVAGARVAVEPVAQRLRASTPPQGAYPGAGGVQLPESAADADGRNSHRRLRPSGSIPDSKSNAQLCGPAGEERRRSAFSIAAEIIERPAEPCHGPRERCVQRRLASKTARQRAAPLTYTLTRPGVYNAIMTIPGSHEFERQLGVHKSKGYVATLPRVDALHHHRS